MFARVIRLVFRVHEVKNFVDFGFTIRARDANAFRAGCFDIVFSVRVFDDARNGSLRDKDVLDFVFAIRASEHSV